MLQSRQGEILEGIRRREFQNDMAVGQRHLARQKDAAQPPAAELGEETEVVDDLTGLGKSWSRPVRQDAMAIEEYLELRPPLRESLEHLFRRHIQAVFGAEIDFLVDQLCGGFGMFAQAGKPVEISLGKDARSLAPALDHFLGQHLYQRKGSF